MVVSGASVEVQVIVGLVTVVATIVGGYWALAALVVRQFKAALDERFKAQEKTRQEARVVIDARLAKVELELREVEKSFLKHLADLPREYMRREDHIRFETVINAKLDNIAARQELLAERITQREVRA